MRDLSVVDRPPTCKLSMTQTLLSIGSLRTLLVDGIVDGRVDWHEVALIGKAICGRMNQRLLRDAVSGLGKRMPTRPRSQRVRPLYSSSLTCNMI